MKSKYEKDFYAWCDEQAEYIAERRFDDIDVVNLEDEIRSIRRRVECDLTDHMTTLFTHLLMWIFLKPSFIFPYRSEDWKHTIGVHREKIEELLTECPSLSQGLSELIEKAYSRSRYCAYQRTTFSYDTFPETMPFSFENAMKTNWLPEQRGPT